jgi:hypothetical protein
MQWQQKLRHEQPEQQERRKQVELERERSRIVERWDAAQRQQQEENKVTRELEQIEQWRQRQAVVLRTLGRWLDEADAYFARQQIPASKITPESKFEYIAQRLGQNYVHAMLGASLEWWSTTASQRANVTRVLASRLTRYAIAHEVGIDLASAPLADDLRADHLELIEEVREFLRDATTAARVRRAAASKKGRRILIELLQEGYTLRNDVSVA